MTYWLPIFLIHLLSTYRQAPTADIVKIIAPETKTYAGKSAVIHVGIEVKEGYHIQAHTVNDEFLIPTTLEVNGDNRIIMSKQVFPKAKKFKLAGTKKNLKVYDGRFEINVLFKTRKEIKKGNYTLYAKFHYQACDSRSCLFPKIIDFIIQMEIM